MPVRLLDLVEKFRLHTHEFPQPLLSKRGKFAGVEDKRKGLIGLSFIRGSMDFRHDMPL
jgi:hypothetical protein